MHRRSFRFEIFALVVVAFAPSSCGQILGLGDFKEGDGSSTTATTGSSTTGTAGGASTTATGSTTTTTTGTGGQNQGGGSGGATTTTTSGTGGSGGTGGTGGVGGTPCIPTGAEDCAKIGDEDCDGIACSDAVWSKVIGSIGEQNSTSVAVDEQGNVLLTGFFAGTMTFGNKVLISAGANDYYLAKVDSSGKPLWAQQFGDASDNGKNARVVVSQTGNIFLATSLSGSANFGGGTLTSAGDTDVVLAAFDPQGQHLWSKKFGDAVAQRVNCLAVDSAGNALIGGGFFGSINFGNGAISSPGGQFDGFIAKFAPNGSLLFTKRVGDAAGQNASYQEINGIAVDPANNIFARGSFSTSVDFTGASIQAANGYFLAKFDSSINHSWSKKLSTGGAHSLIASDASGNILIGGGFSGTLDIDGHQIMGGMYSMYVAKFDTQGIFQWAQPSNGTKSPDLIDLQVDNNGNTVVIGSTFGDLDFGNGPIVGDGQNNGIFLAKFSPAGGSALWSKMFGGLGQHDPTAVATDPTTKEILLTGMITQTVDFGAGLLTSMGGYDVFLAKFQP